LGGETTVACPTIQIGEIKGRRKKRSEGWNLFYEREGFRKGGKKDDGGKGKNGGGGGKRFGKRWGDRKEKIDEKERQSRGWNQGKKKVWGGEGGRMLAPKKKNL